MTVEEPQAGTKWVYVLKRSPVVLGRDDDACDVAIARSSVSKVQSEIVFDDDKMAYRDLDSRNGSIVNGEPIPPDVCVALSEESKVVVGGRLRLSFSRDASIRPSEGICPFAPPRIKRSLVLEPTAMHIGPLPECPPVQPAAPDPRPVVPVALFPMSAPGEEPLATERMVVPPAFLPEPGPKPSEGEHRPASPPSSAEPAQTDWSPNPSSGSLNPGDIVARYRVERVIGRGGMGTVYEVSHLVISAKRFAMKILSAEALEHAEAEARFMLEAKAIASISHPHVVSVVDFGRDRGISYLVMELLEGEDLSSVIKRRKLPIEKIVDIMLAVCSGVDAAHRLGIVHRDLKPANIFLSRNEIGETIPKVLDFGISKMGLPGQANLTQRYSLIGTPNYLSPEQAQGRPSDARCDVYALGAILYECLTGRCCHQGDSVYETLRSIVEADYPLPSALCPGLAPKLEAIVLKALARDPGERFESAFETGRELVPFASAKREEHWRGFYFGSKADSTWESGKFNVGTVSLSRSADQPVQVKTELLPAEEAKRIQARPFRKAEPPADFAPSSASSRDRISGPQEPALPEIRPARAGRSMSRFLPIAAIGLLAVVIVFGMLFRAYRSPTVTVLPPQPQAAVVALPAVESAALALPAAAPPSAPRTPPAAEPVAAAKTDEPIAPPQHRPASSAQRPKKSSNESSPRHIDRNRNGIPILKL
jgi:eukaryotic-like serine/threonine-protein kinase